MIHQPELLLLDEPTAGVDPKARRDFWAEIHQLAAAGLTVLITTHYMDEAVRCHRLGYMAYGELLSHGTVPEVIAAGGLTTWSASDGDLYELADRIRGLPGVDEVVPFGNTLHVSGRNAEQLEHSLRPFLSGPARWEKIEPGLEDVFISLMRTAKDNYQ
jgi:ABC-2 type transport system ATP-binding protein